VPSLAAYPGMLEKDPRRGFTVGQVAWRLGISPAEYRLLEAGEPIHDFRYVGPDLQAVRVAADVRRRDEGGQVTENESDSDMTEEGNARKKALPGSDRSR
jgi:hypothetical protein